MHFILSSTDNTPEIDEANDVYNDTENGDAFLIYTNTSTMTQSQF